jgi:nitrogen regulatory protein P-II 1
LPGIFAITPAPSVSLRLSVSSLIPSVKKSQAALEEARRVGKVAMPESREKTTLNDRGTQVKPLEARRPVMILALVKPFRAQPVLSALESVEILGATVREAMGYGRQKNRLNQYLGSEYNASFLPKVELTIFVEERHVEAAIKAIVGPARTGRIGDGKVLVLPCLETDLSW